jgi:hypothetical protein
MIKRWLCLLFSIVVVGNLVASSTWAQQKPAAAERAIKFVPLIKARDVRPHVEYLASKELRGRRGRDAIVASSYLRDHFRQCNLEPLFEESFYQDIPGPKSKDGRVTRYGRNVGAVLRGRDPKLRDELIIVSAHYDHLGMRGGKHFPGADDNASGTAMLLEVALRLSRLKERPKRSIAFVGFALEEHLLWGSRWFAAHSPWPMENVKFFITADMIGRSLGDLSLKTVFAMGAEYAEGTDEVLRLVGSPRGLTISRLGIDLVGTRSDYGPFWTKKIPFLFFSSGEHSDYHKPTDTPDKVDYEQVAGVSSLIMRTAFAMAESRTAPKWKEDFEPPISEVETINKIAVLLLEQDKTKPLGTLQKLIVSNAERQTRKILERGTVTASERTSLIRTAQLLLFSVF